MSLITHFLLSLLTCQYLGYILITFVFICRARKTPSPPVSLLLIFEIWISAYISISEKNRFQSQLEFLSSLKLIFLFPNMKFNQIDYFKARNLKKYNSFITKDYNLMINDRAGRTSENLAVTCNIYSFWGSHLPVFAETLKDFVKFWRTVLKILSFIK